MGDQTIRYGDAVGPDPRVRGRPARARHRPGRPRRDDRAERARLRARLLRRALARRGRRAGPPAVQGRARSSSSCATRRDARSSPRRPMLAEAAPRGRAARASRSSRCCCRTGWRRRRVPRLEDEAAAADADRPVRRRCTRSTPPRSSTRAARPARRRAPSARTSRSSSRCNVALIDPFDMRARRRRLRRPAAVPHVRPDRPCMNTAFRRGASIDPAAASSTPTQALALDGASTARPSSRPCRRCTSGCSQAAARSTDRGRRCGTRVSGGAALPVARARGVRRDASAPRCTRATA